MSRTLVKIFKHFELLLSPLMMPLLLFTSATLYERLIVAFEQSHVHGSAQFGSEMSLTRFLVVLPERRVSYGSLFVAHFA